MNDIRLIRSGVINEKYDWNFGFNDVDVCRGNTQLVNAVRHAVLLHPGELIQEMYQGRGCDAHNYQFMANTTNGEQQFLNSIEATAKSVDGIYSAKASVTTTEENEKQIKLELLTSEMEEVVIDGL